MSYSIKDRFLFTLYFAAMILALYLISHHFFISEFEKIEKEENQHKIHRALSKLNLEIENLKKHENIKENSTVLSDSNKALNLDAIFDDFKVVKFSHKQTQGIPLEISYKHLGALSVFTEYKKSKIQNTFNFTNDAGKYTFSLITEDSRELVEKGRDTVFSYNLIIALFLYFMFHGLHKTKFILKKHNLILEQKIAFKTQELTKALEKVEEKNKELHVIAHKDFLTGIDNRRSFFIKAKELMNTSIKDKTNFSMLMMDLDKFKAINDTYGHSIGDKVLIKFCSIVNTHIDKESVFGRLGGEEFSIVFINKTIEESYTIAEDIRKECETTILSILDTEVTFTVSFGLAQREDSTKVDALIQKSDALLYKAKESGRNRVIRSTC